MRVTVGQDGKMQEDVEAARNTKQNEQFRLQGGSKKEISKKS